MKIEQPTKYDWYMARNEHKSKALVNRNLNYMCYENK